MIKYTYHKNKMIVDALNKWVYLNPIDDDNNPILDDLGVYVHFGNAVDYLKSNNIENNVYIHSVDTLKENSIFRGKVTDTRYQITFAEIYHNQKIGYIIFDTQTKSIVAFNVFG